MTTCNWILMWVGVQWTMCAYAALANLSNLMYGLLADILTSSLEKISQLITSLVLLFTQDSFSLLALSPHCHGWKGGPQYNEDCTCLLERERKKEVTFVAETMRTIEKHYWMKHLRFMVMCLAQPLVGKTLILIYNLKRGVGGAIWWYCRHEILPFSTSKI